VNRGAPAWRLAVVAAVAVVALLGAQVGTSRPQDPSRPGLSPPASAATQRCFGAAARAHKQPCENPKLRFSVIPSPSDALIEPSAPCTPVRSSEPPSRCSFGVSSARSSATVALVGDSHSVHWRAALTRVARAKRWRAISIYQTRCPYTTAMTAIKGPLGTQCTQWKQDVLRWFQGHPEIHTLFVSQNTGARVRVSNGQDLFEAKVNGYASAWRGLPASVQHIVVIRDPPHDLRSTRSCLERALKHHTMPGPACARPRTQALRPDAAIVAAERTAMPRVRTIDLTRFICDSKLCYPVVGGVLVHKDRGHLTRLFSATLGPFLLRRVDALLAHWS